MTQKDAINIFNIIKNDDLPSFLLLIEQDKNILNVSLGRFPILTVCYLYNSKRIIKKFENNLKTINKFDIVYEPYQLYKDFKTKSQKSLRHYADKNNFVMPIEMKAILGKDAFVKKQFKNFAKAETTEKNLVDVYATNEQKCSIQDNKIKISAKKLTKKRLNALIFSQIGVFATVAIIFSILLVISNTIGLGTTYSPRKVYTLTDFETSINKNLSVALQDDIDIDKPISFDQYSGTLFGNNKSISISYDYDKIMFSKLNGSIENLKIVFNDIDITTNKNLSLLTNTNNGKLKGIEITCNAKVNFESTNSETYFCGFAIKNNGYISNCKILLDLDIVSNSSLDTFASGIAGKNYGNISACEMQKNSKIVAQNVDLAGIVAQNYENAEISSSKNFATLSQTTNLTAWSPNVAGIAMTNDGKISNCYNYGDLSVKNTATSIDNTALFVGGICANNSKQITSCINSCDITAESQNSVIYAGGICAYVSHQSVYPEISYCGTSGNFEITKEDDSVFCFCGGIAGFMIGSLTNSYSASTFSNDFDSEKQFCVALMIGATSGNLFINLTVYLDIQKVYCLASDQTDRTLAFAFTNMGNTYIDNLSADIHICSSVSEIQSCEVYWQ